MANKPLSNEKDGEQISTDKLIMFTGMTDEVAGKIIKAIACYHTCHIFNKLEESWSNDYTPDFEFGSQEFAFWLVFKNMLDSNNRKYLQRCIENRQNGMEGGRPKKPKGNPDKPKGNPKVTQSDPEQPDNVNVNDMDNENVNDNVICHMDSDAIIDRLTDKEYKLVQEHCIDILAVSDKISEKKSLEDIEYYYPYFVSTAKDMGLWR